MLTASNCVLFSTPPTVRAVSPVCSFVAETSGSILVQAPQQQVFDAYDNIERMPEWLVMLESVRFVDRGGRRSEWSLKVPRPVSALARRAGFGTLVRWEAVHQVEAPRKLQWKSLSGFENAGDMTFEAVDGDEEATHVTLQMTYTLPKLAAPLVENALARRFMRYTVRRTMERFRDKMEEERAGVQDGVEVVGQSFTQEEEVKRL